MLDEHKRVAILKLHEAGHGRRTIARLMKVSRNVVRKVVASGSAAVPTLDRTEKAEPYHDEILELYRDCRGNLVRVHEELVAGGAELSYQALTAYCRRHGIGQEPRQPVGQYVFEPGKEMQHDTSPDRAHIGGRERKVQLAGLTLAYSRLAFLQVYAQFTGFECKIFLDDALDYVGGVCETCMIDNTSVIVLRGTGPDMVPLPEMEAFGQGRGFGFCAHEKGDANRSAVVEGFFDFVQNNFLAGRRFTDFDDANRQAVLWCDKINAAFSRKLHASRRELFAKEIPHLQPLPAWRPETYRILNRIVDFESFVNVHGFRYEVPSKHIGRRLEVRETKKDLHFFDGPRLVTTHARRHDGKNRVRLPESQREHRKLRREQRMAEEERSLRAELPGMPDYITRLRQHASRGQSIACFRKLRGMLEDYPRQPLLDALAEASRYGLYDLERVETIVLRKIRDDFFPLRDIDNDEE